MDIIYAQDPFLCNCRPANAGAYRNSGAGNVPLEWSKNKDILLQHIKLYSPYGYTAASWC